VEHRTTYFEIGTEQQAPKQSCVHGEKPHDFVKEVTTPAGEWPRAALAVDVANVKPVDIKAPAVIGDEDPYNSVKPAGATDPTRTGQVAQIDSSTAPPAAQPSPADQPEVRRAEPVRPFDRPSQDSTIKLDPPPPLDF
jgi:hypothetical protein